jgi:predicted DNA-binding transcriptional regulator YafY
MSAPYGPNHAIACHTFTVRADRLLSLLLLLQDHGRLSARALAARLEVSERTINRDMEALAMAGVPVYALRGRSGGWALTEGYRTDLTGLTEAELRSLVVASTPGVLADLGLGEAADRAMVKLLAALPEARRRQAEAARQYLHVDPSGWRRPEDAARCLPTLDEALRRGRRVSITYERGTDRSIVERMVDPLGLVAKGSTWYLVAAVDGSPRTYRASRIRNAVILGEPAERPDGFDLARFWHESREEFQARLPRFFGTIRVAPDAFYLASAPWRLNRIEEESVDDDGWIRLRIRWDTLDEAVSHVLGLGAKAEVVDPPELHRAVLESARALVGRT